MKRRSTYINNFFKDGCCSCQYNLPVRMFRLDANTTLNQSYVLFITLVNITYQSGDQHLLFIRSWDSSPWQMFCTPSRFVLTVCHIVLKSFKCVINLTSFLFKSIFIYFPICDSAHLLSHYYYCYNYYFYYYLLLIYMFFSTCFSIFFHFHCLVMARYL